LPSMLEGVSQLASRLRLSQTQGGSMKYFQYQIGFWVIMTFATIGAVVVMNRVDGWIETKIRKIFKK